MRLHVEGGVLFDAREITHGGDADPEAKKTWFTHPDLIDCSNTTLPRQIVAYQQLSN
jgi:hypothetical protein